MVVLVESEKKKNMVALHHGAPLRSKSREREAMLLLVNHECNQLDLLSLHFFHIMLNSFLITKQQALPFGHNCTKRRHKRKDIIRRSFLFQKKTVLVSGQGKWQEAADSRGPKWQSKKRRLPNKAQYKGAGNSRLNFFRGGIKNMALTFYRIVFNVHHWFSMLSFVLECVLS